MTGCRFASKFSISSTLYGFIYMHAENLVQTTSVLRKFWSPELPTGGCVHACCACNVHTKRQTSPLCVAVYRVLLTNCCPVVWATTRQSEFVGRFASACMVHTHAAGIRTCLHHEGLPHFDISHSRHFVYTTVRFRVSEALANQQLCDIGCLPPE